MDEFKKKNEEGSLKERNHCSSMRRRIEISDFFRMLFRRENEFLKK